MAKGPITDAGISSYRRDGYVLVKDMLDNEEIGLVGRAAREDRVLDQTRPIHDYKIKPMDRYTP